MCNQDEIAGHHFEGFCLCHPTNPRTHVAACLQILHNLLLFFDFFGDLCAHVHKFHHQLCEGRFEHVHSKCSKHEEPTESSRTYHNNLRLTYFAAIDLSAGTIFSTYCHMIKTTTTVDTRNIQKHDECNI